MQKIQLLMTFCIKNWEQFSQILMFNINVEFVICTADQFCQGKTYNDVYCL